MPEDRLNAPNKTVGRSASRLARIRCRGTPGGCRLASRSGPSASQNASATTASVLPHPPPLPPQPLTGLDATSSDTPDDTPLPESLPPAGQVLVALVGVELLWALARSATARLAHRLDGLHGASFKTFESWTLAAAVLWIAARAGHPVGLEHNVAL
jgi:hypothetical protein